MNETAMCSLISASASKASFASNRNLGLRWPCLNSSSPFREEELGQKKREAEFAVFSKVKPHLRFFALVHVEHGSRWKTHGRGAWGMGCRIGE